MGSTESNSSGTYPSNNHHHIRRRKEEKRNLSKKRKRHINNNTLVKHWFPLSFYCLVLQCNLVLFPEMSASQPFRKGSGDYHHIT
jgi:hypothetical protein